MTVYRNYIIYFISFLFQSYCLFFMCFLRMSIENVKGHGKKKRNDPSQQP